MGGCNGKPPYYLTAYGLAVKHGFKGAEEEWLESLKGDSAYALAVSLGYKGTVEEWLRSLKGEKGDVGDITPELEALRKSVIDYCNSANVYAQTAKNEADRAEAAMDGKAPAGHIDSLYEYTDLDDVSLEKMLLNIVTKLESGKQHRCLIHVNQDGMALERGWWFFEITRKDRYVQIHGILGSKEVYRTFITCSNLVHNITSSAFNFGNDTDGDGKADYFGEDLNPANTWVDKNASAFIPFDTTGSNRDKGYAWARDTHGWFYYPMRGTNLYKLHPAYQNFDNTAPWEWTDMCAGITESAYLNTTQGYITYRAISNGNEPYFALKLRVYETGKYTVKIDTGAHGTSNMHFYLIPEAQLGDGGRKELTNNAYKLGNIDISNNEMVKTFEIELHEVGYYYLVTFIDSDGVGDRASAEAGTAYLKSVTLSLETDGDVGGFFSEWAKSDAVLMPGTGVDSLVHRVSEPGNSGNDPRPKATARGAVSLGRYTKTHAKEGFTAGASNIVGEEGDPEVGRNGFAINNGNKVMGDNGTAIGHCNEIPHTYPRGDVPDHVVEAAFVSGMYNKAVRSAQVVFGMFNEPDIEALFIIGNGTSKDNRANGFVVKEDGSILVNGKRLDFRNVGAAPAGYIDNTVGDGEWLFGVFGDDKGVEDFLDQHLASMVNGKMKFTAFEVTGFDTGTIPTGKYIAQLYKISDQSAKVWVKGWYMTSSYALSSTKAQGTWGEWHKQGDGYVDVPAHVPVIGTLAELESLVIETLKKMECPGVHMQVVVSDLYSGGVGLLTIAAAMGMDSAHEATIQLQHRDTFILGSATDDSLEGDWFTGRWYQVATTEITD